MTGGKLLSRTAMAGENDFESGILYPAPPWTKGVRGVRVEKCISHAHLAEVGYLVGLRERLIGIEEIVKTC